MASRADRFFVPDLSPSAHPELGVPRLLFVAESPHVSEVEPAARAARRPLCGAAGRVWWSALSELLEGAADDDVSLDHLRTFCRKHRIAVLNAVQQPLDQKIVRTFPDADPRRTLGFDKGPGEHHYKKQKGEPALARILKSLRARLETPELAKVPVYSLGLDAEWFLRQALGPEEFSRRVRGRIPHPSAWWRRGGHFGRVARTELAGLLAPPA